jgi:Lon-like ATP-dependent protease
MIDDSVIDVLIRDYAREPGVRGLEKCARKITEKIAYRIMKQIEENKLPEPVEVTSSDLGKILG